MKQIRDKYQDILDFWNEEIEEYDDIVSVKETARSEIYELIERLRESEGEITQLQSFILDNELDLLPEFKNYTFNKF